MNFLMKSHLNNTNTMLKRLSIFIVLYVGYILVTDAQNMPEPMHPRRFVNDFTRFFSPRETAQLERKLYSFHVLRQSEFRLDYGWARAKPFKIFLLYIFVVYIC